MLLTVAMAVLAWMSLQVGAIGALGPQVRIDVKMHDAAGIAAGASVAVFGVEVGRVEGMRLEAEGAVAEVSVRSDAGLTRSVVPAIRARSVLGEKYLQLQPNPDGDATPLQNGDVLVIDQDQIEIDELVQRAGVVAEAVDPKALAEALKIVVDQLKDDPERMARFFQHVDSILENADVASKRLVEVLDHADRSLASVDAAVERAGSRMDEARSPIARLDKVLAALEGPSGRLDGVISEANATLTSVRKASDDAGKMVASMDGVGEDLKQILTNFRDFDRWELRRLLREEGILIRLRPDEVVPSPTRTEDVVPARGQH